jgi:hypothetical protein
MSEANAFLKRMLLVAAISALSSVNVAYAHGGGHGSGGSTGGGSASSGSSSSGGHSTSSTSAGHSATVSKGGRSVTDPAVTGWTVQGGRVFHISTQHPSGQYPGDNNFQSRRRHQHLLFGFIRY